MTKALINTNNIELYCVRAEFGTYTKQFIDGGFVAIGWLPNNDLSDITARDELYPLYKAEYPNDKSNVVIGQQVGQISRFLLEIKEGDYVITPSQNTELIYYGVVEPDAYFFAENLDGCPYLHRKKVKWNKTPFREANFPYRSKIQSAPR